MMFTSISPKQAEIFKFAADDRNALICDGAVRSGKTSMMTVAFILWAMERFNECNFGICGKTVRSAERNIVSPTMQLSSLRKRYNLSYTRSTSILTVSCKGRTNYFYIFGGKDESSYMLIQGITLHGVLFDEVALMPRSFVDQAIARTLSIDDAKLWFNCNPENPNHWFHIEWVLQPEKHNAKHLHFLMEDNPGLSAKAVERAKASFSGVFFQRYILGLWVVAEGAIYRIFSENKEKYFIDTRTEEGRKKLDYDFIQIGVDFGGNKSAHTFVASGLKYDYSKLTALISERHEATGLSPDDLYALFGRFVARVREKYAGIDIVYADSAEQTLINGMKDRYDIPVVDSVKNPIIDRIRATTSLMAQGRFFYTEDCKSLEEAFMNAVYDEKSLTDKRLDNGTSDVDTLDAYEYSWERYIKGYAGE